MNNIKYIVQYSFEKVNTEDLLVTCCLKYKDNSFTNMCICSAKEYDTIANGKKTAKQLCLDDLNEFLHIETKSDYKTLIADFRMQHDIDENSEFLALLKAIDNKYKTKVLKFKHINNNNVSSIIKYGEEIINDRY